MRKYMLARILLTVAGLLPAVRLMAQWQDSFGEGLAAWQGMKDCFEIVDGQLRSRGPEKSARLRLSREFLPDETDRAFYEGVLAGDSALCMEFGIDLGFVPSSTNCLRLYLIGADTVMCDTSAAYYLQLGQKGSQNRWQLYHSSSDTTVMLWQGEKVYSKQNQMKFNLRVVYFPYRRGRANDSVGKGGVLRMYHSTGDPLSAVWQADGDSLPLNLFPLPDNTTFHTGIVAMYQTASRFDRYAFDYVPVHPLPPDIPDTLPVDSAGIRHNALFRMPDTGALVINEILFDPRSGESRFVEIYNTTDTAFALLHLALGVPDQKGWRYYPLTKDSGLQIEAYGWKAAAKDSAGVGAGYRRCDGNIFTAGTFPTLSDKAGRLRLIWLGPAADTVRDTVLIDEVAYNQEWHHWLLPDPEGVSLERLRADRSGMEASNWASAAETAGYATPGGENSHVYAFSGNEPEWFTFEPPVVTPDNDACNDFTLLRWNPALSGCMCSITVYDGYGRKMTVLATQLLLGAGGEIRYDATDAKGRILRPGIYVVHIDLVRPSGRHKRLRYPLVVG